MATKVAYRGKADVRKLRKVDMEKFGVEDFSATSFNRNEPTEVDASIAKVLLENEKVFGKFEVVETTTPAQFDEAEIKNAETPAKKTASSK